MYPSVATHMVCREVLNLAIARIPWHNGQMSNGQVYIKEQPLSVNHSFGLLA